MAGSSNTVHTGGKGTGTPAQIQQSQAQVLAQQQAAAIAADNAEKERCQSLKDNGIDTGVSCRARGIFLTASGASGAMGGARKSKSRKTKSRKSKSRKSKSRKH